MSSGLHGEGGNPGFVNGIDQKLEPISRPAGPLDQDMGALRTPLWTKPGGGYSYASSSPHIASIVLRNLTGMEMQQYIQEKLAGPMGFGSWGYALHRNGNTLPHTPGGGSIALRATDAVRLPYLLLHGGKWGNKQLVPAEYVAMCGKPSPYNPHSPMGFMFEQNADGHVFGAPRDAYFKSGAGGSGIYVVPSLDLVIYKMAATDAQLNPELTGLPLGYEPDHSRDNWKPLPHDQFHDGPVGGDDGVRRLLEMVVAAVVRRCSSSDGAVMRLLVPALILLPLSWLRTPRRRRKRYKEQFAKRAARLWSLQPVTKPAVPAGVTTSTNPIDAFIAADYKAKGLLPAGKADKLTLLRRVYLDLIGLPPTPAEQEAFLADSAPDAYEKTVDRLLDNEQHGVRWSRYWLDVLRYADLDGLDGSVMPAAPGIYLWRDWVIKALNHDMPYDQFVRAQILGNRYRPETATASSGRRARVEGSVEDSFALGFLARSAVTRNDRDHDIPFAAVETISTAFMGMTVGCAKCHDHKFDPITQKDFYAMKAIFDPLVLKSVMLATPAEIFANGQKLDEFKRKSAPVNAAIEALTGPYQTRLYDERVAQLTPEVQAMIRKPERDRTPEEQKIFDDYYPVLRIDPDKIKEVMSKEEVAKYNALLKQQQAIERPPALASYWTVEEDPALLKQKSYVLTTGDPKKPEKDHPVEPGFPFQPAEHGLPRRPPRSIRRVADRARESAVRARRRQPGLGLAFRRGPATGHQRFRAAGRQAVQPEAAGLPGFGIRGAQLQHEVAAPADRDLGHLPALVESRAAADLAERGD